MIKTSDTYNPYTPVRHIGIKIRYGVEDMTAKRNVKSQSVFANALGDFEQIIDEKDETSGKYADFEKNFWVLDGTFDIVPDDTSTVQVGLWSEGVSDDSGEFASSPELQFDFSAAVSSIGWTLHFDSATSQYATEVEVYVYDESGSEMWHGNFTGNGPIMFLPYQIADYYSVKFVFHGTSAPYRRLRLLEVRFGLIQIMDSSTIESAKISYGVDIVSDAIPSRELEFSFDNSDKKYNLLDPSGIYEYLQEGQRIQAWLGIDGEFVDMGTFYFTSAKASNNILVPTIQANDLIWTLDKEVFRGGNNTEMTLREAVDAVIDRTELSIHYGAGVASRPVVLAIPDDTSRRESLRLLAQAAMCTVWIGRDETIHFEDLDIAEKEVDELTANELYDYTGVSVTEKTDRVEVVVENEFIEDGEKVIYSAGEGDQLVKVQNCCVAPSAGDAVAAWYLSHMQRRKKYGVHDRGNPAREIGDTVIIHDIYGNHGKAVVTDLEYEFSNCISCQTGGVGK